MSSDPLKRLPAAFGKVLKRRRIERKWTEEALAVAAGLSDAGEVIKLERGAREPTLTELFGIAQALADPPAILFIDIIAAWRGDSDDPLYKSRASDFERLYRLGYYHKPGDFREQGRTYGSVPEATRAAGTLNEQRHRRRVALLDTVCVYVRIGYICFTWEPTRVADSGKVQP
jgi:transcriptional regulator with XRE-family HTH domain